MKQKLGHNCSTIEIYHSLIVWKYYSLSTKIYKLKFDRGTLSSHAGCLWNNWRHAILWRLQSQKYVSKRNPPVCWIVRTRNIRKSKKIIFIFILKLCHVKFALHFYTVVHNCINTIRFNDKLFSETPFICYSLLSWSVFRVAPSQILFDCDAYNLKITRQMKMSIKICSRT